MNYLITEKLEVDVGSEFMLHLEHVRLLNCLLCRLIASSVAVKFSLIITDLRRYHKS